MDIIQTIETIEARGGFVVTKDMPALIAYNPLFKVLVRFNGCRLVAPVQSVDHIIAAMERGGDYCRDVQLAT